MSLTVDVDIGRADDGRKGELQPPAVGSRLTRSVSPNPALDPPPPPPPPSATQSSIRSFALHKHRHPPCKSSELPHLSLTEASPPLYLSMSRPISIASGTFGPAYPSSSTSNATASSSASISTSSSAAGSPSSSPPSSAYGLAGSWERWFGAPIVAAAVAGPSSSSASFGPRRTAAEATNGGLPFSFDFMTAGSRSGEARLYCFPLLNVSPVCASEEAGQELLLARQGGYSPALPRSTTASLPASGAEAAPSEATQADLVSSSP